jgi:peroxiredoxin Q/BCP
MLTSVLLRSRTFRALALLAIVATTAAAQQPAPAATPLPDNGPKVGDMAPDFTLPTATKDGEGKPLTLSSLRGQTVVIAFFPRSRTQGCTAQMKAYRDQYADLFNGGKGVTVLALSTDSAAVQAAWAKEEGFPVTFVSDLDAVTGTPYDVAVERNGRKFMRRMLYVIGPDGRITHVMRPFRELSADAYTELGAAVKKARGS